jgi:hypothetical protein
MFLYKTALFADGQRWEGGSHEFMYYFRGVTVSQRLRTTAVTVFITLSLDLRSTVLKNNTLFTFPKNH